jgi:hypothetical protein
MKIKMRKLLSHGLFNPELYYYIDIRSDFDRYVMVITFEEE